MRLEPHEFEKHNVDVNDKIKVISFTFSFITVTRQTLLDVLKATDNEKRLEIIHNLWSVLLSTRSNIIDRVLCEFRR